MAQRSTIHPLGHPLPRIPTMNRKERKKSKKTCFARISRIFPLTSYYERPNRCEISPCIDCRHDTAANRCCRRLQLPSVMEPWYCFVSLGALPPLVAVLSPAFCSCSCSAYLGNESEAGIRPDSLRHALNSRLMRASRHMLSITFKDRSHAEVRALLLSKNSFILIILSSFP